MRCSNSNNFPSLLDKSVGSTHLDLRFEADVVFQIEELTDAGWQQTDLHQTRDHALWHARSKSDADGHTYRVISRESGLVCLMTRNGSECWELD